MPTIRIATTIDAAPERCFDLARDVAAHVRSTTGTDERAVGGVTVGLLELGDEVTWEARHLGIRQRLTVRISRFERPACSRTCWCAGPSRLCATSTNSFRGTEER